MTDRLDNERHRELDAVESEQSVYGSRDTDSGLHDLLLDDRVQAMPAGMRAARARLADRMDELDGGRGSRVRLPEEAFTDRLLRRVRAMSSLMTISHVTRVEARSSSSASAAR
mgnify:CR=1 FL=1